MSFAPLVAFARSVLVDRITSVFCDSPRWTETFELAVRGIAIGRRFAPHVGLVIVLALRDDGLLEPVIVPCDVAPARVPEASVRIAYVVSRRAAYVPRGHALDPSPVFPALCRICAMPELDHVRDAVRFAAEQAITAEVDLDFVPGTADVASVRARDRSADRPVLAPVPGLDPFGDVIDLPSADVEDDPHALRRAGVACSARVAAWAALSEADRWHVLRATEVTLAGVVSATCIGCVAHGAAAGEPCLRRERPRAPYRALTRTECAKLDRALGPTWRDHLVGDVRDAATTGAL